MTDILTSLAARSALLDGCLVWGGPVNAKGYGVTTTRHRTSFVHRQAHIERHGPPPFPGALVLHSCDNPPCWRDEHLRWGTHLDNLADSRQRGRRPGWNDGRHCTNGHEYTPENTYWRPEGRPVCKTCRAAAKRRYRNRQTEERS